MAPSTRNTRATSSKVKLEDVDGAKGDEAHRNGEQDDGQNLDGDIAAALGFASQLQKTLRKLKSDVTTLQKKNKELQGDLNEARETVENQTQPKRGHRGGPTTKQLQTKVNGLREQVHELEQKRERDRRKIAQLQAKEIRKDAQDLQDQTNFEVGDTAQQMRKLLRKFHDIVVSGSIEDGEECPICMTEMEIGQAYSYTCEHTFCTECTNKLAPTHEETVSCPTCRKEISRDDMDVIQFTASQQWDALLAVAKRWAKIDRRRELETSDEEEEENWLDDGDGTSDAKTTSPEPAPERDDPSSPPPTPGKRRLKRRAVSRTPSVASSVPGEQEIELQASQDVEQVNDPEKPDAEHEHEHEAQADVEPHQPEAEESQGTDGRLSTPVPESGVSQAEAEEEQHMLYSQSPRDVKKRKMEELAERRSKKKRL